jgi:hypothetical protein
MLRKIKNKKGISHVEVILSFVIFIGFLIFLISIINPFKIFSKSKVYLNILERELRNYTSVRVDFLTLRLNDGIEGCFKFKYDLENITVKNETGSPLLAFSRIEGGHRRIFIKGIGEEFYYIYSSKEFKERIFDPKSCDLLKKDEDYTLGLFRSYDLTSYSKLQELKREHDSNYEELKQKLGIPTSKDFSFNVRDTTKKEILIEVAKKPPVGVKVLARDVSIQIVNSTGDFRYAILNIQVW